MRSFLLGLLPVELVLGPSSSLPVFRRYLCIWTMLEAFIYWCVFRFFGKVVRVFQINGLFLVAKIHFSYPSAPFSLFLVSLF